ncbi:hypothetical protein J4Q44_G00322370 [Coregonus suidteri]|uniref:Uncharacterized protein n=1 Tax=Coregonus suidteri TaxID=861788 RepID=A0AAN8KMK2_9TELE
MRQVLICREIPECSPCDITLTVTLQKEDNNRKWMCQLTKDGIDETFIDFTSTFSDIEDKGTEDDDVISTVPGKKPSISMMCEDIL